MFGLGSFDSVFPAYGLITVTLVLLLGAVGVVVSRVLTARRVQCPVNRCDADIVVESQKRVPWSAKRVSAVAECSLLPHGVTCAQGCLNCGAKQAN